MGKYTLEQILNAILNEGTPKAVMRLRTRLNLKDAEELALVLSTSHNMHVEPFDFPGTFNVWQESRIEGTPYTHIATKQLIQTLATAAGVDYRTVEGFRTILPELTQENFRHRPINIWGTILAGMLWNAYSDSPSEAVMDLVRYDHEFASIRQTGIQPYDFQAPKGMWIDENGMPTQKARQATNQLLQVLANEAKVDYRTVEGFRTILPQVTVDNFQHRQINYWGTTLAGMLAAAYDNSRAEAIMDLVRNHPDLGYIRVKMGEKLIRTMIGRKIQDAF